MGFKELLKEKLNGKISEEKLELLPKGFQRIGEIIILNLKEDLLEYDKLIGKEVLEMYSGSKIKSVCNKVGGVTGEFRKPQVELLVGDENTEAITVENGVRYKFDVRKIMFAKGNLSERVRIANQVKKGEIIVDMFAGIGYFSVPIGKLSKVGKIYSIEKNPVSFHYLNENLKLNHIEEKFETINGDCREEVDKLVERGVKADRVLMGYLPPPKGFLGWGLKMVKKGGILHYEDIVKVGFEKEEVDRVVGDVREAADKMGLKVELLLAKRVKAYGPKLDHYVFDLKIG